jgi:Tol biopolymer transport system component
MKRLILILSLLAIAGVASSMSVRSATPAVEHSASSTDGAVIFASNRDGDSHLYAVNADGTGLTRLTDTSDEEAEPLPSPDGKHILFQGVDGLQVMEADGSGRRSLDDCSLSPEAWSSDSRHVVCSGYEEGMIVLDTVDGTFAQLAGSGSKPSWSPDGSTIAFVDEHKLFVMPAAGGARRHLGIRKVEDLAAPAWSPDSQRLAYVSVENGDRNSLWTIRADGSGGRRLAQSVAEGTPSWSPDGSQVAFTKYLPHDGRAVFVVHSDGSSLKNVSGNTRGEYADKPSWSADGHLLYERTRFRGTYETDVYAASPNGAIALTHPFPTGGANASPRWLVGLHASGGEQLPPTIAVPFKRKMSFAQSIAWMATDGTRAVPRLGVDEAYPRLTVWNGTTGRALRGPTPCRDLYGPGYLALAGDRLAWTCAEAGNTYYAVQLMMGHVGDRRGRTVASVEGDPNEGGDDIVSLVGHGGVIAFSNQHKNEHGPSDPWLLMKRKATKCPRSGFYDSRKVCRLLGRQRGIATAIDGARVVTMNRSGVVTILSLRGKVLRSWNIGAGVVTAFLRGRVLAVQHGTTVDSFDARTGAKRQSRELRTDGGPRPFLLGVQGDIVVYATGGAIHLLRLSNGLDRALQLPNAAPALDAHLEPAGLFVSWNKMHDGRPGRIGFIPLREIMGRL